MSKNQEARLLNTETLYWLYNSDDLDQKHTLDEKVFWTVLLVSFVRNIINILNTL